MKLMNFLKNLVKGSRIKISIGKPFDSHYQERTDPIDDIIKAKQKEKEDVESD